MFDWLYDLLGMMMSFFNFITGSYALALLLYALVFKIVFLPFSIKQQKNQVKMAALTPKIELIKAKYRGRTDNASMQKQQQEIMELQQKEGYNALSGCLPLLIQLPIIMLLYAIVQNPLSYIANRTPVIDDYNKNYASESYEIPESILSVYTEAELRGEDGKLAPIDPIQKLYLVFKDEIPEDKRNEIKLISIIYTKTHSEDALSNQKWIEYIGNAGIDTDSIPDFRLFGINLAETPDIMNPSILVLIPVLAAIASWFSMWLSRKLNNTGLATEQDEQTQKSMKIMDLIMPLMTLWIAFNFSGMLGLYWIYQSLLGLLQTFILSRVMPIHRYTPDELREMRRQQKEAEKAARAAAKTTRHRSLHYIDEDDYDELPAAPQNEDSKRHGNGFGGGAPEIKD